ncbi:MAG: hypothetical protein A2W31_00555 [Planctomycetes bacterium RBG_16_64_10]|nr:MAG: hypothetical protein A2W31_00555 [Planctomycetes bacterium RBG_16_64_10]
MNLVWSSLVCLMVVPWAGGVAVADGPPPAVHLVSTIDVQDFGAETIRIGDLNSDGAPDLVFVQSEHGPRKITCLTATTITGSVLWQSGTPAGDHGRIYSDLPVQIYDWDQDGRNEVLYVRQAVYAQPVRHGTIQERATRYEGSATLAVLEGHTGQPKSTLSLPAPADDCFLLADLTGRGRRADLVVKDRYWNMWGVAHDGNVLWHWAGSTGHFPAIADLDDDGRDEVFVGFALIDHDGKVLFSKDPQGAHQDAAAMIQGADGQWRLLFGNHGVHCLRADGTQLWRHELGEAQHVVPGRFRTDSPLQLAVVDRTPVATHRRDKDAWAMLYLVDLDGKILWQRQQPPGAWAIATVPIHWHGPGKPQCILVYGHSVFGQSPAHPAVIYDGQGEIVATLPMKYSARSGDSDSCTDFYALAADVWGDGREEAILFGSLGACVYAAAAPLEIPTLYNETLYPGM